MPAYLLSQNPVRDFAENGVDASWLDGIDQILVYSLPLVTKFRKVTVREGLLLHGEFGWGECAPFWDYAPAESAIWLKSALEVAKFGIAPAKLTERESAEKSPGLAFVRDFVPVNATIPVESPANNAARAAGLSCATAKVKVADPGVSLAEDAARVLAVSEVLANRFGDRARVRVDANAAWTLGQAKEGVESLQGAAKCVGGLEYVEQPCASVSDLAALRQSLSGEVLVAADESIRRASDPLQVVRDSGADLAVVKVSPLGGSARLFELAHQLGEAYAQTTATGEMSALRAPRADTAGITSGVIAVNDTVGTAITTTSTASDTTTTGIINTANTGDYTAEATNVTDALRFPLVVSSAVDSSIGLAAATLVAAQLPVLPYACGLNTGRLLAEDVVEEPLVAGVDQPGVLSVERALGIVTGTVKIARGLPDDLGARWSQRLQAMLSCLETGRETRYAK